MPHLPLHRRWLNDVCFPRHRTDETTKAAYNLTYMIEFKNSKYIEEKRNALFANALQDTDKQQKNPHHNNSGAAVPAHFNLPDNSVADMKRIPLDELQPTFNASRYKAGEPNVIDRGKLNLRTESKLKLLAHSGRDHFR